MSVSQSLQSRRYPDPSALLRLLKPVTWFPPVWAYLCGAVASGVAPGPAWPMVLLGMILAGPVVCGMSQAANDWCDRHVDAINEPDRPIPSGRVPGRWGLWVALAMSALALLIGAALGPWGFGATVLGVLAAWAYSAEPVRLKRSGIWGPGLVGLSYETLPWFTGAAVLASGRPSAEVIVVALLYGIGAHGIMTLNDFKALEGDRQTGVNSLPVTMGPERAARAACWVMALPQVAVIAALAVWDRPFHAAAIAALLLVQGWAMRVMLRDPRAKAPWYNGTGVLLYVSGMMVAAFAVRTLGGRGMTLGWLSIVRLGLVQMALGAIVVLTTSTLNRLMVVELALPATLPGFLVALHYGIQITRPRWGFRSDTAGNRTFWIVGGMAVLALGGIGAALGVVVLEAAFWPGLALSILAYALIGLGVGASGTSLLALLASATAPHRRAAAATITWLMMIFGIAVTAGVIGGLLDPYSPARLMTIVTATAAAMLALTCAAVWRVERGLIVRPEPDAPRFLDALAEVWRERRARNFTIFVFLSMIAYFMQELILEPYAGLVFGYTPGQSTQLAGAQNGGVFFGMLTVGIAATGFGLGSLRAWVAAGCLGSAAALLTLAGIAPAGPGAPILPASVALGYFNGMFAVAAIGAMMKLAGEGRGRREGTRMGLWGAAQAIAAGSGGLAGAAAVDLMRGLTDDAPAFAAVFIVEAGLFTAAALMALVIMEGRTPAPRLQPGE